METFIQQVMTGLSTGALIAIVALGYTLVYGIVELINFAHGDVFMMAGMMCLTLISVAALQPGHAPLVVIMVTLLIVAALFCAVLNTAVQQIAYKPLRRAPRLVLMISAIGMSFIIENMGGFWGMALEHGSAGWGYINFPDLIPHHNLLAGTGITFTLKQLFVVAMTVPMMIGLELFVQRTRLGKAMRATAQSFDAAALMGIDINQTIGAAFLIGGALAGAAGFIYVLYQNEVFFQTGFYQGLNAFTAAVLGGIGNIRGAVVGGLIIGVVTSVTQYYAASDLAPVAVFGTLILIIILRPSGLLGENVPEKV
ncbi:MAG: branched-chain amino acid ABC transporter permease [Candidatus Xenobia bacterium]